MNLLLTPFLDKWGTLTRLSYVLRLICGNIDSIAKGRLKCRESLIQGLKISREKKAVLVGVSVPAGCPGSGVQGCVRVLWLRWQIATTFVASNSTYVLLQCGRPEVGTTLPELSSRRLTNPPPHHRWQNLLPCPSRLPEPAEIPAFHSWLKGASSNLPLPAFYQDSCDSCDQLQPYLPISRSLTLSYLQSLFCDAT